MQLTDIKNPDERKKLLWAIVLGLVAIVFLWWALFGFGRSSQPVRKTTNNIPGPGSRPVGQSSTAPQTVDQLKKDPLEQMRPIVFPDYIPGAPEAKRNIFAYYEKPTPAPTVELSLIHISEPTRLLSISYAVF